MARFSGTGLSLDKGETVAVQSTSGEVINSFHIGLGWDIHRGMDADLDAYVLQMGPNDTLLDLIYYGSLNSKDGAIKHTGDNLTGEGEGDDEVINIDLNKLNVNTQKLIVAVTIYRANLTFADIDNAFVRLVNAYDETEFIRYDLSNEAGRNYTMHMAEIYKKPDGSWDFTAVGRGTTHESIREFTNSIVSTPVGSATRNSSNNNSHNSGGMFGRIKRFFN